MTAFATLHLFALGAPQQPGQPAPNPLVQFVPLVLLMAIFYLVLIRPQQKKQKELQSMLKTLKKDDRVVTNGGLMGVVVAVKEKSVTIRSSDAKFEILKSAVSEITGRGSDSKSGEGASGSNS